MSTITHFHSAALPQWARHAGWFALVAAAAFLIPWLGVSLLDLHHDLYYLVYFAAAIALVGAYVRAEHVDVRRIVTRNWKWTVALGVLVGALQIVNILGEDATDRPGGAYFAFELFWRGLTYGAVDALLLSVFPAFVVYSILRGRVEGVRGKLRFTALALPLVLLITATYHLGYPQYRDDGVRQPEIGNSIISVPTFLTANPVGSVIAHATMHTTAVTHAYETPTFLPPETKAK